MNAYESEVEHSITPNSQFFSAVSFNSSLITVRRLQSGQRGNQKH